MAFPEIEAFAEACAATDETLTDVPADAWERPALGSWNVAQLTAHLLRAATRITEYLPRPVEGEPVVDRAEYFRYDADAESPGIAQRAVEDATQVDPVEMPGQFAAAWRASLAAANDHGPEQVISTFRGPMRLDEFTATRVLEVVVHHVDLRVALDLPPVVTPVAGRMTMALLEQLLGGPRPRNMGRTRFIQAATGRIAADDPRLPVLQ